MFKPHGESNTATRRTRKMWDNATASNAVDSHVLALIGAPFYLTIISEICPS